MCRTRQTEMQDVMRAPSTRIARMATRKREKSTARAIQRGVQRYRRRAAAKNNIETSRSRGVRDKRCSRAQNQCLIELFVLLAGWLTGCYPIGMAAPRVRRRRCQHRMVRNRVHCAVCALCANTIGKYATMCCYIFFPETEHIDRRGEHGPDADAMERHRKTYAHTKCVSFFHIIFCCHFFESQFVWRTHKLFSGF